MTNDPAPADTQDLPDEPEDMVEFTADKKSRISMRTILVAIGVLITVHEFGHFWVARRCGVKVLRFSIGFGAPIWSRRAGPDEPRLHVHERPRP